ncbi:MAG: DUF2231 domain-containing protein [Verrucomicrobiota bacterium]
MKRLLPFFFFIAGFLSVAGAVEPIKVSSDEALQTTAAVFQLFEAKCNDCHGSHLEKPKGKFGYIMDFKKIAENADYVVAGDAAKSEFFRLVNEDEMPGEKSDVPAATPAEKLALRHWIQIGAPTELPKGFAEKREKLLAKKKGDGADTASGKDDKKQPKSFIEKLLGWLGRFHAASTHMPIALLAVAVISELLAWVTKKPSWLVCTRFLVVLGAAGAVGTATLGWLNEYSGVGVVYQIHKWTGTATAVWAILSAGCAVLFECREGTLERNRLRITLLLGAFLVSAAGFLGGALTFGLDHYKW